MADFERPRSPYDNLMAELAAQARKPSPKPTPPTSDGFEFNRITFQFDDLQAPPTTPLLISAPPPKPRRAIITPPRFSLDERLNALRPTTYGDNSPPKPAITNGTSDNNEHKAPQTTNAAAIRLHNDITNTLSNLKPVHSEAKSSFFGLNGTAHRARSDLSPDFDANHTDKKPLLNDRKVQPLQAQAPPPVVMRRLRDPLPVSKKPRFSRDSLEPEDAIASDLEHSNRNSKANSSDSDRTATPNTTLLSLLVADEEARKQQVVSNNNDEKMDDSSPKSARFATPENGLRRAGDGVDSASRLSMGEKRLSQLDQNQQTPVYMSTTVPQNIKGLNIMGRHKPTRTSLRHSRMIVINKNFQSPHKNSLNIKCGLLARIFLILQIIIGAALLAMGMFLLVVWAPHTRLRDNPYWSGIMLILSGVLGLVLLNYKRTPLHRTKENIFMFVKVNAAVILCCTIFFTMLAFIYASIHYHSLINDDKECVPENVFSTGSSCICVFHNSHLRFIESEAARNATKLKIPDGNGVEVHYRDMNCNEVLGVWVYILLVSTLLNLLGLIVSVAYMLQFALGCRKRPQPKYLSVPMRQSAV